MNERLHYACDACWTGLGEPDEAAVSNPKPRPAIELEKNCCFCSYALARRRVRTADGPALCPAGHMPKEQLEDIFRRAADAAIKRATADGPLMAMIGEAAVEEAQKPRRMRRRR